MGMGRRWTVPLIWLPISAAMLWISAAWYGTSLPQLALLFPIGVLVWQLFEYSVHRWGFHFEPTGPESIKLHFVMHGYACRPACACKPALAASRTGAPFGMPATCTCAPRPPAVYISSTARAAASEALCCTLPGRHHHKYPMDFDRLVFPPAPAFLVAGLWYLLLRALCAEVIHRPSRSIAVKPVQACCCICPEPSWGAYSLSAYSGSCLLGMSCTPTECLPTVKRILTLAGSLSALPHARGWRTGCSAEALWAMCCTTRPTG